MNIITQYKNLSVPKKASLWYLVSNILQKGISFFVVPFYVRFLSSAEYGQVAIFFSWQAIFMIFATLNLYCGVYTKAMVDYPEDRDRYTSSMQGLTTVLTFFWFLLYIILGDRWNELFAMDDITSYLLFISFFTSPAVTFWSVRQRVENKYRQMVSLTILKSIVTPLLCIILLVNTDLRANGMIWGILISDSVFGLFFYVYQFVKGKCFFHYSYWIHALNYNIPLIPHYLSLIALAQVDRILIGNICGKDKAGIYGLASQISVIMSVVTSAINGSLVPWLYEQYKRQNFVGVKKASNELCVLIGCIIFLLILTTPEIVLIIGTEEYDDAKWIIPPIALGTYISFCYGLFVNVAFYYNRTKNVAFATTVGACLSIGLNLLLLPRFGFISAGYTSLICYTVFMLMHFMFMMKICKKELNGQLYYDIRFIWLSCLGLFLVMIFGLLLYNFSWIYRYILLIMTVVFIMNKLGSVIRIFKLKDNA